MHTIISRLEQDLLSFLPRLAAHDNIAAAAAVDAGVVLAFPFVVGALGRGGSGIGDISPT